MVQEKQLTSIIAPYIQGLLEEKHALGYDYHSAELILYRFDRYCAAAGLAAVNISRDFMNAWMEQKESEGSFNQGKRISVILFYADHTTYLICFSGIHRCCEFASQACDCLLTLAKRIRLWRTALDNSQVTPLCNELQGYGMGLPIVRHVDQHINTVVAKLHLANAHRQLLLGASATFYHALPSPLVCNHLRKRDIVFVVVRRLKTFHKVRYSKPLISSVQHYRQNIHNNKQ